MKTWRLVLAVAVAAAALLMMTSIVVAASATTGSIPINRMNDDPDPILTGTLPMTHPVGSAIARYFNIPYTQVMALHAEGIGFGVIARAYLTALASGGQVSPTKLLEMHQSGVGWGQIKKEYGVHPGGNGLGTIMREKPVAPSPEPVAPAPQKVKPNNTVPGCPGNSCNAPGHNKSGTVPKPEAPKGPKNK